MPQNKFQEKSSKTKVIPIQTTILTHTKDNKNEKQRD